MRRWLSRLDDALLVAILAAGGWWGYGQVTTTAAVPPAVAAAGEERPPAPAAFAVDALARLDVKGRAPKTGYERHMFGQRWADIDRNGCDTRNDILRRDLTRVETRPGTHGCVVTAGELVDPYTLRRIDFVKGDKTSTEVQIDHVVALADAWQKGAQSWDDHTRLRFANDPLNLLAVSASANQQKGAGDAATWLPKNKSFRCAYVARQVAVKAKYGVWVTEPERDEIGRILARCPEQRLPR